MEEITITQTGFNETYMSYLFKKVQQRFSFLSADIRFRSEGEQAMVSCKMQREYCPYVRKFIEESVADVLSIGYKYTFFKSRVRLPLLSESQQHVLLTALVAADYKDDKAYVSRRIGDCDEYCLDGIFHFRLQALQKRWEEIVAYVPTEMGELSMEGFVEFLSEDGEEKLFVKDGKVYDKDYRILSRSALTGKESVAAELLLGGAGKVYCFGDVDAETNVFLKKYYRSRAVFC